VNADRDIELIESLRSEPAESEWLEFKRDNVDPSMIGVRCSAMSNAARLSGRHVAYMVWGISDEVHGVVGTDFDPDSAKVGSTPLKLWLAQRLKPSIPIEFRRVEHPEGSLVLLEIPATTNAPVSYDNIPYIRIGSATPKLADYPEHYERLVEVIRPYSWETMPAVQFVSSDEVLSLLDYSQYFRLLEQPLPDNREGILEHLAADNLIRLDVGDRWDVLNLGAILFAVDLDNFGASIARKGVRLVRYDGNNKAAAVTHRIDGKKGYASGFEGLLDFINGLLPVNEHIEGAFREARPLFPGIAIRELVANALIHQDMTITGAGPQVEVFTDRIEITNPGEPLVSIDRMIDLPPRSRNESLASLMRRMRICEEQGSGLDKVIESVELYQLPPPKFRKEGGAMQVILHGPRGFADMTPDERVEACYQHAVLKFLSGERMKNASLCKRFGIEQRNAAQASAVIKKATTQGRIKPADPEHPRAGYQPQWG
jgi:predicted HTH transcriptional regulator